MSSFHDGSRAYLSPPRNELQLANPVSTLQKPFQMSGDTSMSDTPDVSTAMDQRLNLTDSSPDDDDYVSVLDSETSEDEDDIESRIRGLTVSELPTGLCYDERMRYHSEVSATSGDNVHPEDPRRIYRIYKELCEGGLVAEVEDKSTILAKVPLKRIEAREATEEECLLVHTPEHYDFVKSTSYMSDEELIDWSEDPQMDSMYFNALSYYSAKLSAGAAIETCRAVVNRTVKNAIAVIRPPGHHAEVHTTMGFCLFNNVCIASRVCQNDFGESCKKILIVDWDVHHGNGGQKAFYEDPDILYISIHVHMNGSFYPSGPEGGMDRVGRGAGLGKNVNIPWPTKGMGDADYIYAFQHVVMPIAAEFNPDLVIVAAGFDAAAGDELGGCFVTPACYAHMTHMLMSLANGKVAVCLEGGYNFRAISMSALAVTKTLMGEPPDRLLPTQATAIAVDTVEKVRAIQANYWDCIFPKDPAQGFAGGRKLHDILRKYQAEQLYEQHKMTRLAIFRDTISKSFEDQVLASRGYENKQRLLVIFHDPPDVRVPGDRLSTLQRAHEIEVLDGADSYLAHAISHSFGVIDVNIPEHITLPDPVPVDPLTGLPQMIDYASNNADLARREAEKLATYLWENYIEPVATPDNVDKREIFLMGCGHAFHAVARLISENDNVYQSLTGVVGFIATNPVRPVKNNANPWVSSWYRENSLVFVSNNHSLWKKEGKVSKRYGRLEGSDGVCLNEMMKLEEQRVWEWIGQKVGDDLSGRVKEEKKNGGLSLQGDPDETETDEETKRELERDVLVGHENSSTNGVESMADDVVMSTEQ